MDIPTIIALWLEGYYTDSEVLKWADDKISESDELPDDYLIALSTNGPKECVKMASYEFPGPRELGFIDIFQ